jgi:Uma2 family endonuclease
MSAAQSILDSPPFTARPRLRRMTEREFVDWCEPGTWAEWVDGEVVVISPVSFRNAEVAAFLFHLLRMFIDEFDLGTVLTEPFQIRFGRLKRRRSPDVFFISKARRRQIRKHELEGPADLIIEVVSPWTQSVDRRDKFLEYQSAGVKEYWIVDPQSQTIEVYALGKNRRYSLIQDESGLVRSRVLPGFYVRAQWLWRDPFPRVSILIREMRRKMRRT